MATWTFLCIVGIAFVILEMFTPSMFFLNFAISAFITAITSLFIMKTIYLSIIFLIFSFVSFIFLRPFLLTKLNKSNKTGIEDKYIGKKAKVIETITKTSGAISIYDERWEARVCDDTPINVGEEVKIIRNESLKMFVEKV